MAQMTHPTLPGAVAHVADESLPVWTKAGWVAEDGEPEVTGTETLTDSGTAASADVMDAFRDPHDSH